MVEENNHFNNDLYWYLRVNGQEMFRYVASLCEGKTLDIGCGECNPAPFIGFDKYVGFDISDVAINKAKSQNEKLNAFVGDLHNLPSVDNVDTILMCGVLFYFDKNYASDFIKQLQEKYHPKKIVCCEPISWGMSLLNPTHYEIKNFNLTDKDLVNGNKHFINWRQILVI